MRPVLEAEEEKKKRVVSGIPIFRTAFGEEELAALRSLFESQWLGTGPRTVEFEERFAQRVGAAHAVAVNSCTAALHLSCAALGLQPGDEILIPTLTFVSTAHAVSYCGARPVFVDVDPVTGNLDPGDLLAKLTPRSKGVIPVHYGGRPCDLDAIWEIAEKRGLWVVEDAAHACGATYGGSPVGGLERTRLTCFSFNALKNLSCGDGGMITTNSAALAEHLRKLRWLGIEKSTYERSAGDDPLATPSGYRWYYQVEHLGFKYCMNDINATLGLVQLDRLDERQAVRLQRSRHYTQELSRWEWLDLPPRDDRSAWHLYTVRTSRRDALKAHLQADGIATSIHYLPIHLQSYYREAAPQSIPNAEGLWRSLLTLPFHPDLTSDEVDFVLGSIHRFGNGSSAD